MSNYLGKSGTRYELIDPPWKSGGEGFIYQVKGNSNIVAKIFKEDKRSVLQQRKLEMMSQTSMNETVNKQTTWPQDLLYENQWGKESHKPIGYIMKSVVNSDLLCEINGITAKDMSWEHKIMIAINLCSAVSAVHSIGHVIGDMNPRNIMVSRNNYMVTLIDTDSYHIIDREAKREYRCNVGIGEYIAPELMKRMQHGERLDSMALPTFTKETDNFALAIHIFTLLMDGWHPFTCRILENAPDSIPCPQKKDNILTGFSPYFNSKSNYGIPKQSPTLDRLPGNIQKLFWEALIEGYQNPYRRPDASQWEMELRSLYGSRIGGNDNKRRVEQAEYNKRVAEQEAAQAKVKVNQAEYNQRMAERKAAQAHKDMVKAQKEMEKMKKSRNYAIGIVIVLILLAIGYYFLLGRNRNIDMTANSYSNEAYQTKVDESSVAEMIASDEGVVSQVASESINVEIDTDIEPHTDEQTAAEETIQAISPINRYEYVIQDLTWEQAYEACLARGGHLVTFETEEEYDYVLGEILAQGYHSVKFFIGSKRRKDGYEYYWLDQDGNSYGECINDYPYWMKNEPSFGDEATGEQEEYVDIFYYAEENRWVWNDIPNDISKYYSGNIGYICEYER